MTEHSDSILKIAVLSWLLIDALLAELAHYMERLCMKYIFFFRAVI